MPPGTAARHCRPTRRASLVALGFVRATVALAAPPLRAGKRVPLAGAAAQVALLGCFTATVAAYAAGHGLHRPAPGDRLGFTLAELVPLAAVLAAPSLLARRHHRRR